MPFHVRTPLIHSVPLSEAFGAPVHLKLDCLQPVGSFKIRGIGRRCERAAAAGARRFVASSGGNAGYAVACAGRMLGLPVCVVVPSTTPAFMVARIRAEGAEVRVEGAVWDEAHAVAMEMAGEDDCAYVHPFEHPDTWAGHATLIEELAEQGDRPGAIVASVGGGGLLCGVLEGMAAVGWGDVPVLAAETEGAASFAAAMAAGRPVALPGIESVAKSLGARTVSPTVVERAKAMDVRPWVVSDAQAVGACLRFLDDHRLMVEPACGAALAAAYERAPVAGSLLIVVCGGAVIRREDLNRWAAELGP